MTNRQYVACKFRSSDTRTYTYHNDGAPLAVGDTVTVEDRGGGSKRVEIAEIVPDAPKFPTKPVLAKIEPEPDAIALGDDADLEASLEK